MKRPVLTLVLCGLALACTACSSTQSTKVAAKPTDRPARPALGAGDSLGASIFDARSPGAPGRVASARDGG